MKYHWKIHIDFDGITATCLEFPNNGCTQGDTLDEVKFMIRDWLETMLDRTIDNLDFEISERCNCPKNIKEWEEHWK